MTKPNSGPSWKILALLCLLSGMASLIYETLWIRVLSLGVGSTSASLSMVLAIYFLGLSAGSYFGGRFASRLKNPLRTYSLIEGGIGLYGAGVIFILFEFHKILGIFPLTGSFSWLGTGVKIALVSIFLALPTFLMGATLPLLVRILVQRAGQIGRTVSLLYGLNTLGAVLGSLVTAFVLIPQLGILKANGLAAGVNFLIFGASWVLSRTQTAGEAEESAAQPVSDLTSRDEKRCRTAALLTCLVCGFSSIAAEVVWSKYLSIFFGSNIYGLGLVLSLFLVGIALGSIALANWIEKVRDHAALLGLLLVLSVLLTLGASYLLNLAPVAANIMGYYLGARVPLLAIKSVLTAAIMFLPTCVFGAAFPLAIRLVANTASQAPRVVGTAYSINTIGSILGSCLAGLFLIPKFGSGAALAAALVALLLSLTAWISLAPLSRGPRIRLGIAAALTALVVALAPKTEFRNIIKSAYHQGAEENLSFTEVVRYFSRDYEEFKLISEGESGIVSLSHDPQDGEQYRKYLRLKTNGLNESVYDLDSLEQLPKYEALLGFLPYLFVRDPQKAFIVGYGGGYTVDFLTTTDIREVRVAELEKGILAAADVVHQGKNPILARPNLKLQIDDARYVLATGQGAPYDIIVSQPSHSWLSGVANLFTREFFQIVSENLSERGVFSQWLNLYNMDPQILKSILRTFYSVFPHGAVFTNAGDQEMIMIGSNQKIHLNMQKLQALTLNTKFRKQLAHLPFTTPFDLVSNFAMGRSDVMRNTEDAPINTDVNAYAEVGQSNLFYAHEKHRADPHSYLEARYTGDLSDLLAPTESESQAFYGGLLESLKRNSKFGKLLALLSRLEKGPEPETADRLTALAYWCLQMERYPSALKYLAKIPARELNPNRVNLGLAARIGQGDFTGALALGNNVRSRGDALTDCYLADAWLRSDRWRETRARSLFVKLSSNVHAYTQACGGYFNRVLGRYFARTGDFQTALPFLEAAYKTDWSDTQLVQDLAMTYLRLDQVKNGIEYAKYLETSRKEDSSRIRELAASFRLRGLAEDAEALEKRAGRLEVAGNN